MAQTYNPELDAIVLAKPIGAIGYNIDRRTKYFDEVHIVSRAFVSTDEVIDYYNTPFSREGQFKIFINEAGVLQPDGTILGGSIQEYWWKDGTSDSDLVEVNDDLATKESVDEKVDKIAINKPNGIAGPANTTTNQLTPISNYLRAGSVYHNLANGESGELYSVFESINKFNGVPISDDDVDYKLYYKFDNGKYGIRYFPNNIIDITEIGAKASLIGSNSGFDNTLIIQKAIDFLQKRIKEGGGTVFFPKCSSTQSYKCLAIKLPSYIKLLGEGRSQIEALPSNEPGLIRMNDSPMREAHIEGIQLIPNIGNPSQHGLDMTGSTAFSNYNTGGAWYCTFRNIMAFGFGGNGLNLVCQDVTGQGDVANQFLVFENCKFEAKQGSVTSRAMYVKGQFGQTKFTQCQFDGSGSEVIGSISVEMISTPNTSGTDNIYSIDFDTCTIQRTDFGVVLDQARARFQNLHTEQVKRVFWAKSLSRLTVDGNSEIGSGGDSDGINTYTAKSSSSYVSMVGNQLKSGYFVNDSAYGFNVTANNFSQPTTRIGTKGFTKQRGISPDGVLSGIFANRDILLNLTNQDLITISSQIISGETLTITGFGGSSAYILITNTNNIIIPSRFGNTVILRDGDSAIFQRVDLPSEGYKLINFISKERFGSTPPMTGIWFKGEKMINTAYASSSDPIYWICTVSSIVDAATGTVASLSEWKAIYDQDYGRPSNMSQRAINGTTLTFRNEDQLVNTNSGILDTITVPTAAYIRSGYRQAIRVWENGVLGSYILLKTSGNITLPNYQKSIVLRGNDYAVFAYNNFAGIWVLESINRSKIEGLQFPAVGYWFAGETVYNTNPISGILGWINLEDGYSYKAEWATGAVIANAEQRYYLGRVYRSSSTGTAGTIPPTHTSGTVSDGNINWTYLGSTSVNIQELRSPIISINTTLTVYTKASLNSEYSNAKKGDRVIQDAINKTYTKKDDLSTGNWSVVASNQLA